MGISILSHGAKMKKLEFLDLFIKSTGVADTCLWIITFFLLPWLFFTAGSAREALQTNRQTEEPAAPNATTTLPAQFKQRTPMYNSNSNPPATTPTSPLTPTTPPAISPAAQAPQVAPQTQQQPPPKKSLSLTVSKKQKPFLTAAFDVD